MKDEAREDRGGPEGSSPGGKAGGGVGVEVKDPGGRFRAGFAAIVGRPNVGKSTLLNLLLGEKVTIVSDRPQTTRNTIRGILTGPDYQIVFLDTPGIHKAKDEINRYMVRKALETFGEVDVILFMVEADADGGGPGKGDLHIGRLLRDVETPVLLVINKMDRVREGSRKEAVEAFRRLWPGWPAFPVSALTGEGVEALLEETVRRIPEGHPFFPADQVSDQPLRFLSAEMIREKVFLFTGDEVPYSVAVEIESFREDPDDPSGLVSIEATIHVERPSQKGILIGREGRMLKKIGTAAREDLERLIGAKVFLKLWVKVTRGWKNDPKSLRRLGYR